MADRVANYPHDDSGRNRPRDQGAGTDGRLGELAHDLPRFWSSHDCKSTVAATASIPIRRAREATPDRADRVDRVLRVREPACSLPSAPAGSGGRRRRRAASTVVRRSSCNTTGTSSSASSAEASATAIAAAGPRSPASVSGSPTTTRPAPNSDTRAAIARRSVVGSPDLMITEHGVASTRCESLTDTPIRRSPRSMPTTRVPGAVPVIAQDSASVRPSVKPTPSRQAPAQGPTQPQASAEAPTLTRTRAEVHPGVGPAPRRA